MSVWDNPELRSSGDYVKFENIGDRVAGQVVGVRARRFDDGRVAPEVMLITDDGEEKSVTAGQWRLKQALVEQRPEAGDHIAITLTDVQSLGGGKTLKIFDVVVTRGTGTVTAAAVPVQPPATAPAPAAAPAAAPDTAALAAALSKLSPEQKALLGFPAA